MRLQGQRFKADFLRPKPRELDLRVWGPLKSWHLPLTSPICSLYVKGNLPLASTACGTCAPQLWGAYQVLFPQVHPHPMFPFRQCVWKTLFRGGGLKASWRAQLGLGTLASPTLFLTTPQKSSYLPHTSGQLQGPINLAVSLSLPAALQ